MNKRKVLVAIIIGLFVGSLAFYTISLLAESRAVDNYNALVEKNSAVERKARAITLRGALEIAHVFAKKWSDDAALISLVSADVDDPDAMEVDRTDHRQLGQDGRRRTWQAVFTSPSLNKQLHLQITDGVIAEALEDGIHDIGVRTLTFTWESIIDSPELIKKAKEIEPNLSTSVGRGKGYHFIFQTGSYGKPVLTVVGSHQAGDTQLPATITFDQETGQFVESKHYIDNRGVSQWEDF
jgi:hypothetical protein